LVEGRRSGSSPPDPALDALWKRVLDDWEDDGVHSAFLEYCQRSDRLVDAAVRYRGMSGDRVRAQVSEKKLKAVALLAMTRLEVARLGDRRTPNRAAHYVLLVAFVLAIFGLLAYLGVTR
jgi:hypothetical protein